MKRSKTIKEVKELMKTKPIADKPWNKLTQEQRMARGELMEEWHSQFQVKLFNYIKKQKATKDEQATKELNKMEYKCNVEDCNRTFKSELALIQHKRDSHIENWIIKTRDNTCNTYKTAHTRRMQKFTRCLNGMRQKRITTVIKAKDNETGELYFKPMKLWIFFKEKAEVTTYFCPHCGKKFYFKTKDNEQEQKAAAELTRHINELMEAENEKLRKYRKNSVALKRPSSRHSFKTEKTYVTPKRIEQERIERTGIDVVEEWKSLPKKG